MIPNLFILGAPKCGTTAITTWLANHSAIYVPSAKEPHHFSSEYCRTPDQAVYQNLYNDCDSSKRWAIDASVWYLFSPTAVSNILDARPDASFIILLRNPLRMIPSMHSQQIFNGNELEFNLERALLLSDRRYRGEPVSVANTYPPAHLAYFMSCALGWQVQRLFSQVSRNRVHVVFHDDLEQDPGSVMREIYYFLSLEPLFPDEYDRINSSKARLSYSVDRAVRVVANWKERNDLHFRLGFLSMLRRINRKPQQLKPLSGELHKMITSRMHDDIELLSSITDRDLSQWLDP